MGYDFDDFLICLVLADKAGGKKFSKDFEEGSAQLQEFVKFFDKQNKILPQLMEALTNADIFYEMQYKEVKIVANVSERCLFLICIFVVVVVLKHEEIQLPVGLLPSLCWAFWYIMF